MPLELLRYLKRCLWNLPEVEAFSQQSSRQLHSVLQTLFVHDS
jgi:hypothetical protein